MFDAFAKSIAELFVNPSSQRLRKLVYISVPALLFAKAQKISRP